jgi:uncharacterized membrane protein
MTSITDDTIIFGLLAFILAGVFYTQKDQKFSTFYKVIPAVLLCYLLPALLVYLRIIDPKESKLYFVASRYLLPAALVLMTLSVDLKAVLRLGPKSLIMFFTGTVGIIIGGPLALIFTGTLWPELLQLEGNDAIWRGLATVAGSWIGGGANQAAMLEVFSYNKNLYGSMVLVDVLVANFWLAILIFFVGKKTQIDHYLMADSQSIDDLIEKMEDYQKSVRRVASTTDLMLLLGVGFGSVGIAHFIGNFISSNLPYWFPVLNDPKHILASITSPFLWMVLTATVIGILASKTSLRSLDGIGSSNLGSVFIYLLVATIGMQIDLRAIGEQPELLIIGLIWILIHSLLLFLVGKWIKAPYFFLAVGSQANVGGAATAPVIAASFHPALSSVGILLAICGYIVGTIGAYLCALLLQAAHNL